MNTLTGVFNRCGCEQGNPCTRVTLCRAQSMVEEATDPLLEAIECLVDAMRRSDPDYVKSHGCQPCCDEDWDAAIQAGEDALEIDGRSGYGTEGLSK